MWQNNLDYYSKNADNKHETCEFPEKYVSQSAINLCFVDNSDYFGKVEKMSITTNNQQATVCT